MWTACNVWSPRWSWASIDAFCLEFKARFCVYVHCIRNIRMLAVDIVFELLALVVVLIMHLWLLSIAADNVNNGYRYWDSLLLVAGCAVRRVCVILNRLTRYKIKSSNPSKARFQFKRNRLHWQAANHGCHCFDRAFLLAGACVCCVKFS